MPFGKAFSQMGNTRKQKEQHPFGNKNLQVP